MQRHFTALFGVLFILQIVSAATPGAANASGGQITELNLSFSTISPKWQIFYGNSNSGTSMSKLNTTDPDSTNVSTVGINLPTTQNNYWISDGPSPDFSSIVAANLTQFDQRYGFGASATVSDLFNQNATFNFSKPTDPQNTYSLTGPAVFFEGYDIGGNPSSSAFSQGLFQSGSDFVFLVPKKAAKLSNGSTYDFVFVLPYSPARASNGSLEFYLFANQQQATTTPTGGTTTKGTVPVSWLYNESGLYVFTRPNAMGILSTPSIQAVNDHADSSGVIHWTVRPGKYYLTVIATGYGQAELTLNLKELGKKIKEFEEEVSPGGKKKDEASITKTDVGNLVCFGDECYYVSEDIFEVSDFECKGEICKLVGINRTEFVRKYAGGEKPTLISSRKNKGPVQLAGLSEVFSGIGDQLSEAFMISEGGTGKKTSLLPLFAIVLFISMSAVFIWNSRARKPTIGHD